MSFFARHNRSNKTGTARRSKPPNNQDTELDQLAVQIIEEEDWAHEFDADEPRHRQLVLRIAELMDEPNQMFLIKKRLIKTGTRRGTTAKWTVIGDHLTWPTIEELETCYSYDYGGGKYEVWSAIPRKRVRTVEVFGPSSMVEESTPKSTENRFDEIMEKNFVKYLEANPDVAREFSWQWAMKKLGTKDDGR